MTKPKSRAELNNPQGGGGEERKKGEYSERLENVADSDLETVSGGVVRPWRDKCGSPLVGFSSRCSNPNCK